MLDVMERHNGEWPRSWKLLYAQRQMMHSLEEGGYIKSRAGATSLLWTLTDEGREALQRKATPAIPRVDRRRKNWTEK